MFSIVDEKAKIFQSRVTSETKRVLYSQMINTFLYIKPSTTKTSTHKTLSFQEAIKETLFEYYEDRCVVIDKDFNVHYIKGNLNDLLHIPSGEMRPSILKMFSEELSLVVRSLVYKALNEEEKIFPQKEQKIMGDEIIKLKLTPLEGYERN